MDDQMFISGKLVSDDSSTKLWNFTNRNINYLSPGKLSDVPRIKTIALPSSLRNSKTGYENITHLVEEQYLFGTSSGYIIIDLNKLSNQVHEISINSVTKNVLNEAPIRLNKHIAGEFNNQENNIEFNYSVPEFQKYLEVQYQYQLVGIYDYWSNWEDNSNQLFKNLPYGDYTFKVQARVGNIVTNNVASYQFSIAKPWHLSNTAMLFYILIVTMVSFVTHNVYKRYYSIQREKLLEKTERALDLKKMENEQQLMSFKNEKLQNDIESKNRELAISTMSLIKKNEFLNNIKEELKSINKTEGINPVIKIIDTNLNNTDDWKLFEEAFNNADKDFLKKVKTKHTSLTSNDLRLCAYLRLNLSSKEIAPLLNISPRSVEVKRYRLRKKMELPHEASLTNYILDL
jgi:DNA-binding CsgD family transcriptional regulator